MKTRTSILLFVLSALFLIGTFYFTRSYLASRKTSVTRAKVVNPTNGEAGKDEVKGDDVESQIESFETLIQLKTTETFIASVTVDVNADTFEDEIVVIRKPSEKNLVLILALYNPDTTQYNRVSEIPTSIFGTRTFSLVDMDVIGEHQNAIVCQGLNEEENSVMQIFMCEKLEPNNGFSIIGDFVSDGTIFVSQTERPDAYELSLAKGDPYSVWVYKSDAFGNPDLPEDKKGKTQIQQEYKWNPLSEKYELSEEIIIATSKLESVELSKIQDGTVETFAGFLDGLWYKTSNVDSNFRYFFFDYKNKEIIQFIGDIQEIFQWEISRLRHNGIYISTVNSSIANLHRRIDIGLMGVDQIRITTWDDVNLPIREDNLWNGTYKRLPIQSFYEERQIKPSKLTTEFEKGDIWTSEDGFLSISLKDDVYLFKSDKEEESGVYSFLKLGNYDVVQFRANQDNSKLLNAYAIQYAKKVETKRGKEVLVDDKNKITLTPVTISPIDCYFTEGEVLTFSKE